MNIIQIQDRLKGLPEEALVNYVEQPMGEVPIYLALGELQRRKEMKERFQASQPEKPSVAEQLVAEAKPMQMGLGAMAPQRMMPGSEGVGAPQPAPEIDPRQMAASGIAANPVKNVGQYAKGGIVGYQTGGNIGNIDMSDFKYKSGYLGDALGSLQPMTYGNDRFVRFGDPRTDPLYYAFDKRKATEEDIKAGEMIDRLTGVSIPLVPENIAAKRDKLAGITDDSKKEEVKKEEPKVEEEEVITTTDADDKVRADLARIKSILGEDPERQALADRLADKEDRALNMALIRGGLGIAAGQSANFLENLAKGATAGVESYAKTQEDILEAQRELAKQKRTEDLALLGKALDAEQSELDRASKERIAKDMSPTGGFNIAKAVLSNDAVQDYLKQIKIYKDIKNPTKEQTAQLAKLEAELLALQQKLYTNLSRGFGAGVGVGTGQTSSLTERQKELLGIYK